MRPVEVDALRRRRAARCDDGGGVVGHLAEAPRGEGRHRDMVLLVGGGRQRIDRGGMGQRLVLGGQRRRRHMGDHEAGIEPALGDEEGRQAAHHRVGEERDAALGEGADLGDGEGEDVGGDRHRLGVEIAAREDLAVLGEDQRVVGDGDRLDQERAGGMADEVEAAPITCGWQRSE